MENNSIGNVQGLVSALNEMPSLTLSFYSYGIMLRRQRDDGEQTEYPVDPKQVATALAAESTFETGLLNTNTLSIRQKGVTKEIIEYRPPQITGIFLEGSDDPLRVPLPGLVMVRITGISGGAQHKVYAVKQRPVSMKEPLYYTPLPNIFGNGGVCWGSVPLADKTTSSLEKDWAVLLGSTFGNHSVAGKSKKFKEDIRKQLLALHDAKARVYPHKDLVSTSQTLTSLLRIAAE